MCGIVGYIGSRQAQDVLISGLAKLEYRGYDSAGVAVGDGACIAVKKKAGKLANLSGELEQSPLAGTLGIGHTRWATHGLPNDTNAHPHATEDGRIVIIHNGIIENYLSLKEGLLARGHTFKSETDSEVLAHLIEEAYQGDLYEAVRAALGQVRGAYGIVVTHVDHREIVAARTVSPLVMGVGEGEMFLASDVPALLPYTRKMVFLHDGDMAVLNDDGYRLTDLAGNPVERPVDLIEWDAEAAEKGGFDTYMLKEIYEQPQALTNTLIGRLHDETGEVNLDINLDPQSFKRISIIACGTAYYAGLVGEYLIEQLARIPVEVDVASEYRYRNPLVSENTLAIVVSQSGETIDTLEALREAKKGGAKTLGVINAKGSSMTRELDDTLYIHAGPEIGVASTKAYTSMVSAFVLLALWLGRARGTLTEEQAQELLHAARELPRLVEEALAPERVESIRQVAEKYAHARDYLFLGRGVNAPTAFEGALKLKEISYIHAEAYAAGEMKHGPIALIDANLPVVVVATESRLLEKTISNVQEVKARSGKVIALLSDGDTENARHADDVLYVPRAHEMVSPVVNAVAMQLLAYFTATALGKDVDKPRNLAKSVTVE
ncbi:glutamine--fructose-6-phosphate transaminase (isomerizing) [Deinococcus metallilatus]|uniref:Glutamine--fructose-6-phosphate aminotransferase [isomerizing] n=1 Tax=Deinococcus metallilatus TaxID=1211322 RepID=A0AAJ5JYU2_9DEIO|nr:glutamine--fructose-6-phosphate transaminase (isomerizing) [Deinococcus metallilatus]MBB5294487.1 glucosamine--fructose-6-phosphate aminotransferase (isomerizing) [Deinococcus metallilatus]QBY07539.1 glutamine--fructose-6-phosphate transaminase (isomerizing) [Deinococcus metallilatus]RXJ13955.1 glutamine--fructose-6-phosphate transaminase (isomerizing) [Deinococcus metallilatus]TLK29920.1 glutamine--fructose-6-phosphate transaminase (isomerizing) [Deinococcus metallilatus]GMA15703.1 glutami